MLDRVKASVFERKLKKAFEGVHRNVKNKSFNEVSNILFFFDCTSEEKYREFERIYKYCQELGKSIRAVGYTGMRKQAHYCTPRINFEYLLLSDYNYLGIPNSSWVEEMIATDFDLLIDLSHCMHRSFQWLITLSNANCKLGASDVKCKTLYDISIDTENDRTQRYLMQQLIVYLNMLKNKNIEK